MHERALHVLTVDEEFRKFLPSPDPNEIKELELSLIADGCRDSVIAWGLDGRPLAECVVVDGHTRYDLCHKNNVPFTVIELGFADRRAVRKFMARLQLGRRNISEPIKQRVRVILYEELQSEALEEIMANPSAPPPNPNAVFEQVAQETGVSVKTVQKDVAYQKIIDKLTKRNKRLGEAAAGATLQRGVCKELVKAPDSLLADLAKVPDEQLRASAKEMIAAWKNLPKDSKVKRPITSLVEIGEAENKFNQLTKALSKAFRACKKKPWAAKHREPIRLLMDQLYEHILAWKKEAASKNASSEFNAPRVPGPRGWDDDPGASEAEEADGT